MGQQTIHHISDTARWAAVYRAREAERQDALFRDPFARRLAGQRGEEIAQSLPFHDKNSWSWITRTCLFDQLIGEQVEQGADMVVSLAAGLDARPYRMKLPSSLTWVEVDLPEILDYKEQILGGEKPVCRLERVRMDLADVNARRGLIESLGQRSRKAVVLSEGLLIYLTSDQVRTLANDLAGIPSFQRWIFDIVSPPLMEMIRKNTAAQIAAGAAELQFAPPDGPEFFAASGWTAVEVHSMLKSGARLKRLPLMLRLIAMLPENPAKRNSRPWSAVCLLKNDRVG